MSKVLTGRILLLLVVALSSSCLWCCDACKVTMDGTDVTAQFLTATNNDDSDNTGMVVQCIGNLACKDAWIEDCPKVLCQGREACNGATIMNFTTSVDCIDSHSCHRAELYAATTTISDDGGDGEDEDDSNNSNHQTVTCQGDGACDVTTIHGGAVGDDDNKTNNNPLSLLSVLCFGRKSCRKASIRAHIVKCTNGDSNYEACSGYAGIEADCLLCGTRGCNQHVNICRYKLLLPSPPLSQDEDETADRFEGCVPESAVGTCPDDLLQELEHELHGDDTTETHNTNEDGARNR
jgi:hypothetical protein